MIESPKHYHSKILLFGEYTVILGSQALAVPYQKLYGYWTKGESTKTHVIYSLLEYLKETQFESNSPISVQLSKLSVLLDKGSYFESNIPTGYGVGSSGALTAAVFDTILLDTVRPDLEELKTSLSLIESYFHGSSSGLDPLVSWMNRGIQIKSNSKFQIIDTWELPNEQEVFFLLDTGIKRKTSDYVKIFKSKIENKSIPGESIQSLSAINEEAIAHFLEARFDLLFQNVAQISEKQYQYFREMIPSHFDQLWKQGLESDDYKIKLCGAGGGGFLMGMANKKGLEKLKEYPIITI